MINDLDLGGGERNLGAAGVGREAPALLEFAAAPALTQQVYQNRSLNTWGGSVIRVGNDHHLFMSAMANGSTLNRWSSVSYVARAVAETPLGPLGPYTLDSDPVLPVFTTTRRCAREVCLVCCYVYLFWTALGTARRR